MNTSRGDLPGDQHMATAGEVGRFVLVGAAATGTHYLIALGTAAYLNIYIANLLGYLTAVAVSYFGHQRYSFQLTTDQVSHQAQLPRFILASVSALALSYLVLAAMENLLETPDWLSLAAAVCLVPLYTFLITKRFVFRPPSGES